MDFFEVVEQRKAVRKYIPGKIIPDNDINKILQKISLAPSARNLQSYKIYAVKNNKVINKIFHACFNQKNDFICNSSLVLVFCADPDNSEKVFGARGKNLYAYQDATIAASFGILTVTALGYSSCWVGNFREEEIQKILKTKLIPIALVIVGYSDEKPPRNLRKPLNLISEVI